jgi:glutathione S-transferase
MKLIGSVASPYVRKVRIVMAEKKIDHELVVENVWSPDTTISLSNPLGKVPCLIMEDGGAMFDSRVIVEYLDTLTPVGKLIPTQGRERASVKCWEALADGAVGCALGWLSFRFPEITWRDDYPNLAKLFDKLSERASFKDTAPH